MKRRAFLKGAAGAAAAPFLPSPSIAQTAKARTLTFVPQSDLSVLDPIWTTNGSTTNHGYHVFDTLYGVDKNYRARPQMAEGHTVSDDGLTWQIKLRPGLKFHDGEPVLARDCVASVLRWTKRDTFGSLLAAAADAWEAADDRTIRIRLKTPFPALPDALGHPMGNAPFMMPERLAKTDAFTQVREMVGSGPFRFLADEFRPGNHVAYAPFTGYVPRDEPAEHTSGGKRVYVDRFEWKIINDPTTASSALQTGEIDWWELATSDLLPVLTKNPDVRTQQTEDIGYLAFIRFNALVPPFDNPRLRNVVLKATTQADFMHALGGEEPKDWRPCYSMFPCGLPAITEVGAPLMKPEKDFTRLKAEVLAAGYKGEQVIVLNQADSLLRPLGNVAADLLRKLGMNVELVEMDSTAFLGRRNSKLPVEKGGWNLFTTRAISATVANPALNIFLSEQYVGWGSAPELKALVQKWLVAPSDGERTNILKELQQEAFETAVSIPLGQLFPRSAFRKNVSGILQGSPTLPWNVRKA